MNTTPAPSAPRFQVSRFSRALLGLAVAAAVGSQSAAAEKDPVKVFLLVGQSNMQGKGSTKHLKELVEKEPKKYGHLWKDGAWTKRDDVWGFFGSLKGREADRYGPLTVGPFTYPPGRVGPEIGFGDVVGDALEEPVLLLKICWGGQSLAVDFRPPAAGKWDKPLNKDDDVQWKPGTVGWAYKQIFNEIHHALDDKDKLYPELKGREFEIVGLVWFQGWNDLIKNDRRAEYKDNLVHFIREIRKDLGKEKLPIVIGEVGHGGTEPNAKNQELRDAQAAPAKMDEFAGTVVSVPTGPYWDDSVRYDGGYHYNGSASFYYDTGRAFGEAMLKLLKGEK